MRKQPSPSVNPASQLANDASIFLPGASHALPMKRRAYGGSVTIASTLPSGSSRSRSRQSPTTTRTSPSATSTGASVATAPLQRPQKGEQDQVVGSGLLGLGDPGSTGPAAPPGGHDR